MQGRPTSEEPAKSGSQSLHSFTFCMFLTPTALSSTVLTKEPFSRVQGIQRYVRLFPLLIYLPNVPSCCQALSWVLGTP